MKRPCDPSAPTKDAMNQTNESDELARLRAENAALRSENAALRAAASATAPTPAPDDPDTYFRDSRLSEADISRYARQMTLPGFGAAGQARLKHARVLVVGAGGLGSPAILYLAGAGVGHLGIADGDVVETGNLHRQVIHRAAGEGVNKALSAAAAVRALNADVRVTAIPARITAATALATVAQYDVVVDATDSVPARYILSDACCAAGRPLVTGAALRGQGQVSVFVRDGVSACYRCLHPTPPAAHSVQKADTAGVLGPAVGVVGCLEAVEALKLASGVGAPLVSRMVLVDVFANTLRVARVRGRQAACPACGDAPTIRDPAQYDYDAFCGTALLAPPRNVLDATAVEAGEFAALWRARGCFVVDVRSASEYAFCALAHDPARCANLPMPLGAVDLTGPAAVAALDAARASGAAEVVVVCRRGVTSHRLAVALREAQTLGPNVRVRHLDGGLLSLMTPSSPLHFPSY